MKSHLVRALRVGGLLVVAFGLPFVASAQDQTVNGNLSVAGDADISGSTLSLGSQGGSASTPGLGIFYQDATAPTINFGATRATATWVWQSNNDTQFQVDGTNTLSLFAPGNTTAAILLSPAGTSSFSGNVSFNGGVTMNGSLQLPNQALAGSNSVLTQNLANQLYLPLNAGAFSLSGAFTSDAPGFAAGEYSMAAGQNSTAFGFDSYAGGDYSIAMGYGTSATGQASTALGSGGSATGGWSFVAGYANVADGDTAVAMGYQCVAPGGSAFAMGYEASANGMFSTAIGYGVVAEGPNQFVIGEYNVTQGNENSFSPNATDNAFIIGNGSNGNPSNAFSVNWNGDTLVGGKLGIGVSTPAANFDVAGAAQVRGVLHIPPSGDLSMGSFTAGTNPVSQ